MSDFNQNVIAEFRANAGKVGGPFAGRPMLLLTTTGARSGQPRTSPLIYTTTNNQLIILTSKNNTPTNPAWYHNLVTNPEVTLEVGTEKFPARASVATGQERDRLFAAQAALMPGFADYQRKTTRQIPVVTFERQG